MSWLDDNTVIAASSDGIIRFWKIESNTEPALLRTLTVNGEVRDMELNQKLSILTVAAGAAVYFFTMNTTYALIHSYPMPIKFTNEGGASLHPNGTKFIAGGSDLWLRVFDYNTGKQLECLKGHHGPIRLVCTILSHVTTYILHIHVYFMFLITGVYDMHLMVKHMLVDLKMVLYVFGRLIHNITQDFFVFLNINF